MRVVNISRHLLPLLVDVPDKDDRRQLAVTHHLLALRQRRQEWQAAHILTRRRQRFWRSAKLAQPRLLDNSPGGRGRNAGVAEPSELERVCQAAGAGWVVGRALAACPFAL